MVNERLVLLFVTGNQKQFDISTGKTNTFLFAGFYLSKVLFVCCVIEATSVANVFIRLVLYSCIDETGDFSLDMTHASKKFAFDSHSDSSFVSFVFWSSLASAQI